MNMTRDRVQSFAWTIIVLVGLALLVTLTFKVNAVKSQVQLADRNIRRLEQEKVQLETEFETRSNHDQLTAVNAVQLGLEAPRAAQYLGSEPQLAALSKPETVAAPSPILMASAEVPVSSRPATSGGMLPAVLSTVSKRSLGDASSTRMLAQHGEHVAPGGRERLEKTLTLASAQSRPSSETRQKHAFTAAPAAPPSFLAAAIGVERLHKAEAPTALATKPVKKSATVADAFGSDWMRQMSGSSKTASARPGAGHRRVAAEDTPRTDTQ
jgi:hypothetical protein